MWSQENENLADNLQQHFIPKKINTLLYLCRLQLATPIVLFSEMFWILLIFKKSNNKIIWNNFFSKKYWIFYFLKIKLQNIFWIFWIFFFFFDQCWYFHCLKTQRTKHLWKKIIEYWREYFLKPAPNINLHLHILEWGLLT